MEIRYVVGACYLGRVLVAVGDAGVCAVLLGDSEEEMVGELGAKFPKARVILDDGGLGDVLKKVTGFVEASGAGAGMDVVLDVVLDVRGTDFQKRVWAALCEVPVGETRTYSEIAAGIGAVKSVRAVASACGANKLAVVIPCHRVVAKDGGLAGYRWGVERKRALLERERLLK